MMDSSQISVEEKNNRRKKRVRNLKRAIIFTTISALLLPTIMCIILFVKVGSLQKQINTLNDTLTATLAQKQAEEELAAMSDGIYANEIGNKEDDGENIDDMSKDDEDESVKTPVAYLTFDDGPSENTQAILDILKEYDIKATFFVIGKETDEAKELYKRIIDEGHTLGMHSYSHQYSKIYASVDAFAEDLNKIQTLLEETTGIKPKYYRFPGGSSNQVSNIDMTEFIKYFNETGITYFDWNVSSADATSQNVDADIIVENVIKDVTLYDNSIILMHDALSKTTTVEALPQIIEKLQEMGIEMRPITDDVKPVQHIKADSVE